MLAKNQMSRNKMDNKAKFNSKTLILYHLYKTISMDILSGNDRSKYVTVAKPLKTQYFGDFDVVKF